MKVSFNGFAILFKIFSAYCDYKFLGCAVPGYIGDGSCDDENNFEACGYDGGDCCGSDVNTNFCTACLCLDPSFGGSTDSENTAGKIIQIMAHVLFFTK